MSTAQVQPDWTCDRPDVARLPLPRALLGCASGMAKRGRLQDELNSLSNRGLLDIGFTRGEIDRIQGLE